MNPFRSSLRRTCAAFAASAIGRRPAATALLQHSRPPQVVCRDPAVAKGGTSPSAALRLFSTATSSSSSFQPADPPGTHGTPVFSNIDFSNNPSSSAQLRNTSPSSVFVVTGANRGIGLQFVKSLLERTKGTVVACCRNPEAATELQQLKDSSTSGNSRLKMFQLDVEDQNSIEAAGAAIRDQFDRVDLLLNVAGILGDAKTTPGPERSIDKMDRAWFEKTLAVNLIGPVMLTKELLPLLKQRRRRKSDIDDDDLRPPAVVANLSARVGSISDNNLGGWYSYRMSKTALNQATRTLAHELKRHSAWALAMHPGTTDTGLSEPFQGNLKEGSLFPVEFTVTQLLNVIDSMEEEHSGGLYDWAGQALSF